MRLTAPVTIMPFDPRLLAGFSSNSTFFRLGRPAAAPMLACRILRLMRVWHGLYKVVLTFIGVLPQLSNLLVLIFLFVVILALLGMQVVECPITSTREQWSPKWAEPAECSVT